jgi:hypothetical protein
MIPVKDKNYQIHYIDEQDSSLSYIGSGLFTGNTEIVEEGCLFHFLIENSPGSGFTDSALFSEQDILNILD